MLHCKVKCDQADHLPRCQPSGQPSWERFFAGADDELINSRDNPGKVNKTEEKHRISSRHFDEVSGEYVRIADCVRRLKLTMIIWSVQIDADVWFDAVKFYLEMVDLIRSGLFSNTYL